MPRSTATAHDVPHQHQRADDADAPVKQADPGARVLAAEVVERVARQCEQQHHGRERNAERQVAPVMPAASHMDRQQGPHHQQRQHRCPAMQSQPPLFERVGCRTELPVPLQEVVEDQPQGAARKQHGGGPVDPSAMARRQAHGATPRAGPATSATSSARVSGAPW